VNQMETRKSAKLAGVMLIGAVGLIHLFEASEYFEVAAYVGLLFVANIAGAALSGVGILRNRGWGWWLGALVAGGAFVAYVASRTVGLPGAMALTYASFFEPSGVISLVVEFLFVALSVTVFSGRAAAYQAARNE
jgi:hypothetical protein